MIIFILENLLTRERRRRWQLGRGGGDVWKRQGDDHASARPNLTKEGVGLAK